MVSIKLLLPLTAILLSGVFNVWGALVQIRPPISVPMDPWGFDYPARSPSNSSLPLDIVEIFCSLIEPNCSIAWDTLKSVQQHYSPQRLRLIFHDLAVPSKFNALLVAQGTLVIEELKKDKLFDYIEQFLQNSASLSNEATYYMSENQVVSLIADYAVQSTGIDRKIFLDNHPIKRGAASQQWKYATARTVSYAPTYFVNGVDIMVGSSIPSYGGWISFLDQLVQ